MTMPTHKLPYFGEIDFDEAKDHYLANCEIDDRKINLHLFLKDNPLSTKRLDAVTNILNHLEELNKQNKNYIRADFNNEGEALGHVQFYMEELEDELEQFVDTNKSEIPQLQLLNKLQLKVIFIQCEDDFEATFDYALYFDGKASNQVLGVKLNADKSLKRISWES